MRFQASSRFETSYRGFDSSRRMPTRDRWDKPRVQASHPVYGKVRSYRGIPDGVDAQLQSIATSMKVPVGEVVRAMLEFAIAAHSKGQLCLEPHARQIHNRRKNTLFPKSECKGKDTENAHETWRTQRMSTHELPQSDTN